MHLDLIFSPFLPPGLLAQAEQGPHSREQIFSLRRTFFGVTDHFKTSQSGSNQNQPL
jgi:hypothetical protein